MIVSAVNVNNLQSFAVVVFVPVPVPVVCVCASAVWSACCRACALCREECLLLCLASAFGELSVGLPCQCVSVGVSACASAEKNVLGGCAHSGGSIFTPFYIVKLPKGFYPKKSKPTLASMGFQSKTHAHLRILS